MNEHLYAYLVEGEKKTLVSINDCCEEDRSKTFVCPGCGGEMGLRLGNVRIHHFYHKTECNCPGETYKHMLTKELFKRYFDSSETMLVNNKYKYECEHVGNCEVIELWKEVKRVKNQIPASCQTKYKDNVFDLKKYYTTASIEKHEDKYIADVLLTGDNVPDMLVEIKVTHKCTEDKQSSGHKIIEFDVSGIEESEIEKKFKYVADKVLTFDEAFPVKFYGMKKTDGLPPKREFITNLSKHGSKFWTAHVETCSCKEYKRRAELFLPNERKAREQKRVKRELKKKRELEYADQQKAMEEFRIVSISRGIIVIYLITTVPGDDIPSVFI